MEASQNPALVDAAKFGSSFLGEFCKKADSALSLGIETEQCTSQWIEKWDNYMQQYQQASIWRFYLGWLLAEKNAAMFLLEEQLKIP